MKFSVIVPARNEEKLLPACLDAIAAAAARVDGGIETVVVLNRCTDATGPIAAARGALLVREDARNLAVIRNAGAARAGGDILVTVDADSRVSPNLLSEAARALASGRFIGGGVPIYPERFSPGVLVTGAIFFVYLVPRGLSVGAFWCRREDFHAVGGFRESLHTGEDLDFARRLKARGRRQGKRYGTLWRARITTSCRKFDRFGDWYTVKMLLRDPRLFARGLHGTSRELGDRYWYDCER